MFEQPNNPFPLHNPFRKNEGGAPPRPPQGSTPKEWVRLYIMALVFLLTVGTMIYMRKVAIPKPKKDKPTSDAVDYSVQGEPRKGHPEGAQDPPRDPEHPVKKEIPLPPLPKDGAVDFRELASPFQDGRQKPVKETPEFIGLLNVLLNSVTPENFSKRVNPNVSVDQAYLEPAKYRGEALRAYGRLIYIYTERLEVTTPNNLEYVYLGILQEYPKNRTIYFYLPERPRDPKTGEPIAFRSHLWNGQTIYDDWVEVEGVFLRTYDYPGQKLSERDPDPLTKSAVLFVKNLKLAHKPQYSDHRGGFIFVVSILTAVVVAIVIVAGVMSRKYSSGSLRMKLFSIKRSKGKGIDFPKPSPEKQVLGAEVPNPAAAPAGEPKAPPPP